MNDKLEHDDFGGIIEDWSADRHEAWKISHEFYREKVRTENITRRIISFAIVGVFVVWATAGSIYLMFFNGNLQVLITGSAFISGPFGIVIGYYFGLGENRRK